MMQHSARRALLVVVLGFTALTTAACDPAGYEAWSRMLYEFAGGVISLAIAIIVIIASLPPL